MAERVETLSLTQCDRGEGLVLQPPGITPRARRRVSSEDESNAIEEYMLDHLNPGLVDDLIAAGLARVVDRPMGDEVLHIPEAGRYAVVAIARARGFRVWELPTR